MGIYSKIIWNIFSIIGQVLSTVAGGCFLDSMCISDVVSIKSEDSMLWCIKLLLLHIQTLLSLLQGNIQVLLCTSFILFNIIVISGNSDSRKDSIDVSEHSCDCGFNDSYFSGISSILF